MTHNAYVTLITNEYYYHGAVALGISLLKTQTKSQKVVLVSANVSSDLRDKLARIWDQVLEIGLLDSRDVARLDLIGRPELGVTFSKLHVWELVQFNTCVFLDADTLVLRNIDELFEREELSAAPDTGWPDCFNSGVFVFRPNLDTYQSLLRLAEETGSFDGADQGLLNTYWGNWMNEQEKRLSFTYNVAINTSYFYNAAILKFKSDIRVLHYLGTAKPWLRPCYDTPQGSSRDQFYARWWEFYNERDSYFNRDAVPKSKPEATHTVIPDIVLGPSTDSVDIPVIEVSNHEATEPVAEVLTAEMEGLRIEIPADSEAVVEKNWRLDWQRGHIEFEGKDASNSIIENILNKL